MNRVLAAAILFPLILVFLGVLVFGSSGESLLASPPPVKDQACLKCHGELGLAGTSHRVLQKTVPDGSCEACHGAGDEHVTDLGQTPTIMKDATPAKIAGQCASCHSGPSHVTNWEGSSLAKQGKTCADCHQIHAPSDARASHEFDERGYTGDSSCRLCHRPVFEAFGESFHAGVIGAPGGGCEACHGPGRNHVLGAADGVGYPVEGGKNTCLTCHRSIPDRHAREMPVYKENRPACVVCHDVHVDRKNPLFAKDGPAPVEVGQKAGSESCAACHSAAVTSAKASVHASLLPENGCESCHGPALAHVKSGGRAKFVVNLEKLQPAEASGSCLSCHADKPDHAKDWKGGPLEAKGLTCLTCHEAHGAPGTSALAGAEGEGKYVGSKVCAVCHSDPHPGIERSPHASLVSKGKKFGCEECHGPGAAHVGGGGSKELIRNPANLSKSRQSEFCMQCHSRDEDLYLWQRSVHGLGGLTCSTCHEPLKAPENKGKKQGIALCVGCHNDVAAQFRLPNRHPLYQGAVTCLSCHSAHSQTKGFMNIAQRKEQCLSCHRQYQGPFLFEHEADRTDGCTICHMPHGSPNRRLLTYSNVADLCIQCHVTPPSHSLAQGSAFRNCLSCHGSIHGSYIDKNFFR